MSIKHNFILFFIFLFVIGIVSAFNFEKIESASASVIVTYTGNITNLSQLSDTTIGGGQTDNQALAWDDATNQWIPQTLVGTDTDTNVTTACSDEQVLLGNGSCMSSSSFISFWNADTDLGGYKLTNVGGLIMSGLITSQNITPLTNNLYSLGNSTNWFKEIFVTDIYSKNINATEINTTNLNSQDIASDRINATNVTIGGFDVYKDEAGDMNIDLG